MATNIEEIYEGRPSPLDEVELPETEQEAVLTTSEGKSISPLEDEPLEDSSKSNKEVISASPLELEGLEKLEDGTFQIKLDDQTVYTGKTVEEVLAKSRKGHLATINALKEAKAKLSQKQDESLIEQTPEKIKEILLNDLELEARRSKINPKFLRFTEKEWLEYQDEQYLSDEEFNQLKNDVNVLVDKYQKLYSTKVAEVILAKEIKEIREQEIESAQELLADLPKSQRENIDIEEIVDKVLKDKDNSYKNGKLIKGKISAAIAKAVATEIKKSSSKTGFEKKLEDELEKKKEEKKKVPGGGGVVTQEKEKPKFKNYRDIGRYYGAG